MNPQDPTPLAGRLIVIEGIDGTGKSTQATRLAQSLRNQGVSVLQSREPTDGPWGKKLREAAATGRLPAEEELELFIRDRQQHVDQQICPALAAGKTVILDRYYFSNMAYQGARGFDPQAIRERNEQFAPPPDLLLILDLEVETALERIGSRGDEANAYEQRSSLQACREIYLSLSAEPFVRVISAADSLELVGQRLDKAVEDFFRLPVLEK